jgi:DNA modification methylase
MKSKAKGWTLEEISHIDRSIAPEAHSAMYVWHKFWSRKTWNVVSDFIKCYTPPEGIVFDPFSGSGVTGIEAVKNGRRAIIVDLNPIATEISRLTLKPISEIKIMDAFERIEIKLKKKILKLYETKCRKCGFSFSASCFIWDKSKCIEVRYDSCPKCGDRKEKNCKLNDEDKNRLLYISNKKITSWYPQNPLYYPDGKPFKEKQKYDFLHELFTKRNLMALSWLIEEIENETLNNKDIGGFLQLAFTSFLHLCSKMCPISEAGHFTPFSSAWTQHSYWYPSGPHMEQNVWHKFESSIKGHQGLIRAKKESNQYFKEIKIAATVEEVLRGTADIYIHNGSCLDFMGKLPSGCIDYVFTDPPYDSSIQFGELSYLWVAWLKKDGGYLDNIVANEIIRNERQCKDFEVYNSLIRNSFEGIFRLLKPGHFLTVTFHNPTFKVRNSTIRAGTYAGFSFEKIHHQPLARPSTKSLMQPFGSAQGDFYLRFKKQESSPRIIDQSEYDENKFRKIVIESTIKVLAERAEPTPYTIIINYIDPQLAKHGFFQSLSTGLDVKKVLQDALGEEFTLVSSILGGTEGQLWWFKDENRVLRLKEIPLSERVEETVYRVVKEKGRVTFTEVWNRVSIEWPNSLTSDSMSIMAALQIYAKKVRGGYWLMKPEFESRRRDHHEILAILALVGKKKGFDIWIGKKEQSEHPSGLVASDEPLRSLMTINKLNLIQVKDLSTVQAIDLLWIKNNNVISAFEIEATTSMTSALLRGSNLQNEIPKYLVIPEEREEQLSNKMKSPLFAEHFSKDNWRILYIDAIRNAYIKDKLKIDVERLIDMKNIIKKGIKDSEQTEIF